jgi:HEAT repeat protein
MVRKEIEATRKLVFNLLQNDLSPSQRIMGVKAAYEAEQKDDAIVNALIKVMNEDPNVNVRLSAMEALSKFSNEIIVRKALIESLHKQTDPVMQIALIQVLVQLKEKEAVQSLKEIIESEVVPESVKDEAYGGIIKLNS